MPEDGARSLRETGRQHHVESKATGEISRGQWSIYDQGWRAFLPPPDQGQDVPGPRCGVVDGLGGVGGLWMDWRTEWVCDWLAGELSEKLLKLWERLLPSICTQH